MPQQVCKTQCPVGVPYILKHEVPARSDCRASQPLPPTEPQACPLPQSLDLRSGALRAEDDILGYPRGG